MNKIFNDHKVNNANNSINQNQRYSNKDDDDDEYMQDDEINKNFAILSHRNKNNRSIEILGEEEFNKEVKRSDKKRPSTTQIYQRLIPDGRLRP